MVAQGTKARWLMPAAMPGGYAESYKHLSPIVAQILYNRGVDDEEVPSFLHPTVSSMHAPRLMRGMDAALARIAGAIDRDERIAVYGDFDVDGVTGTVLLYQILRALGANVTYYVPHRATEGYGLNNKALDLLGADGVRLVITVDCGISCVDEVAYARDRGIEVIVTDHHLPPAHMPEACAILNPRQPGCNYPFKDLSGVGVAFKLASALLDGHPEAPRLRYEVLDLVVIGTVADMVPLRGENRILVRHGLKALSQTSRVGLRAMLRQTGLDNSGVSAADISFRLGPRLNAAGRLDHAAVGCELLLTTDQARADELVAALERTNDERQRLTTAIIDEVRLRLGQRPPERILIVDDATWPAGIIGLVAGRLTEEYCRPVLVVERGEVESRGSARSIPGFNVIEALTRCADLLHKFGGHAQAAGFSLRTALLPALHERLAALAAAELDDDNLVPSIRVDAEITRHLPANGLTALHEQLCDLEPFGVGNPTPVLLWRNLRVADCRVVGSKHLRFSLATPQGIVGAIAFGRAGDIGVLPRGHFIDVVFNLQYNDWHGYPNVELRVKDVALKGDVARAPERGIPQVSVV